jgi:hypothetical protein
LSAGAVFANVVSVLASRTGSLSVYAIAVVPAKCSVSDSNAVPLIARFAIVFLTTL